MSKKNPHALNTETREALAAMMQEARDVIASGYCGIPAATIAGLRNGSLVAVPREPTKAMKDAGDRALAPWIAPAMHSDAAYRAILAATDPAP